MKKGYIVLGVVFLLIALAVIQYPVIFQEGNPILVFFGIMAIELTGRNIVPVPELKMIQKAGEEDHLSSYLAGREWLFAGQFGSGIIYKRNDEQLKVTCRMYTERYIIYEFDRPLQ